MPPPAILTTGDPTQLLTWRLGSAVEHCPTCLLLDGHTARRSEFLTMGLWPRSGRTLCDTACRCRIVLAPAGALPTPPPILPFIPPVWPPDEDDGEPEEDNPPAELTMPNVQTQHLASPDAPPERLAIGAITGEVAPSSFAARFVRTGPLRGQGNRRTRYHITAKPLQDAAAAGMFDARAVFLDHADKASVTNVAGVTEATAFDGQAINGRIRLYDTDAGRTAAEIVRAMLTDQANGKTPPDIGLSIVFYPTWEERDGRMELAAISHVDSVDIVFQPAADGRITGLDSAEVNIMDDKPLFEPAAVTQAWTAAIAQTAATNQIGATNPPPQEAQHMDNAEPTFNETLEGHKQAASHAAQAWTAAIAQTAAHALIGASGLPAPIRERLASQQYVDPQAVTDAISAARAELAALQESNVIVNHGYANRSPQISGMRTGLDAITVAFEALMEGRNPQDVAPLSGIREAYIAFSGDYQMTGKFLPERVALANVTSSTMANMVANVLNKRLANAWIDYPQWWNPIVVEEDFATLQSVKWITLGGVGELPTVAEGAAYTELTWDDAGQSNAWVKKGGYLGITLEAIDKDDVGRLRAAPRALAQAGWLTLSKTISEIFTSASGAGPTMDDTGALFNATAVSTTGGHANLGTSALSHSAWVATRLAMRKQTELNSGERLGGIVAPKYLLVPPDLENTALVVMGTDRVPGGANWDTNMAAQGDGREALLANARERVIVVDLWTDTNNWAAVADPRLYPCLGIGYRFGRTPEIFSVASPTAGLMFSNDVMPIKVRFTFAAGPIDFRGLYKHNVT